MSATNGKWELGVVDFFDSFEDFDQFTELNDAYAAPSSRDGNSLNLSTTVSTDYRNAPFYMHEELGGSSGGAYIPGSELIIGPSSDSSYEGAIDKTWLDYFHSSNKYTVYMPGAGTHSQTVSAFSAFNAGDPVLIRTVPHGWTPGGNPASYAFGVKPIGRYDDLWTQVRTEEVLNQGGLDLDEKRNVQYLNEYGVRLVTDSTSNGALRHIYKNTPVNSFDPRMRRWRIGWNYRISRANPGSAVPPQNLSAEVALTPLRADGGIVSVLSDELYGRGRGILKNYTADDLKTTWTFDTATMGTLGNDANTWDLTLGDNPSKQAVNRINRFKVELALLRGRNTAFDVDDFCIEHAHGTSQEANGYYELDGFPSGGINWRIMHSAASGFRTSDNTLKVTQTTRPQKQKFSITARFEAVSSLAYHDMLALLQWQQRGKKIVLRPYHPELPQTLVGRLAMPEFSNELWDLGLTSFTLVFEQA